MGEADTPGRCGRAPAAWWHKLAESRIGGFQPRGGRPEAPLASVSRALPLGEASAVPVLSRVSSREVVLSFPLELLTPFLSPFSSPFPFFLHSSQVHDLNRPTH